MPTHALPARRWLLAALLGWSLPAVASPSQPELFAPDDIFELEVAADPRISPKGDRIVYVRTGHDRRTDRTHRSLWVVDVDGAGHRPLTAGPSDGAPRWSPSGDRLLYVTKDDQGDPQLAVRWMDEGQTTTIARLPHAPAYPTWAPDGSAVAFAMHVPDAPEPFTKGLTPPEGAEWAAPPKVIERVHYRSDGQGYLDPGARQLFVVPAEGGTPRQLTEGPYEHDGPVAFTADGKALLVSANRGEDWELNPLGQEIYEVSLSDGGIRALTSRPGPDVDPVASPDGRTIAYLGFDDERQGYHVTQLYVMDRDGGNPRSLTANLDRSVRSPVFSRDGKSLWFSYDDRGVTRIARVSLAGRIQDVARDVGGTSLGRPYPSGSFTVASNGRIAFTVTSPNRPADVATQRGRAAATRLTRLNEDLLGNRRLGKVEGLETPSSVDGLPIQGWIVRPPGAEGPGPYPTILEIHGGPFANYGPRFSVENQLYAAAGYAVLYVNPRGSTSYGHAFGNAIHHAYPGHDYDDLMSAVDAAIAAGVVDPDQLYVTGGSGGGVLTSWIVGKTDRFRAAVVAKPVINWTSFVLTSDAYPYFTRYWFPGAPWDEPQHYFERSPISLVGNVTTPTMLLTGEADHRTPITESEQLYQALKLRGVDTALVRFPGASHHIAARPSHLAAKVDHVLAWFERYRVDEVSEEAASTEPSEPSARNQP